MRRINTSLLFAITSVSVALTPALAVPTPSFDLDWKNASETASHMVTGVPTALQARIARQASTVASRTGTVGWCFRAVKGALKPFGIKLNGGAAYMASSQLAKDPRFVRATVDELQPGDIMVHGRSNKHPYGHIAVYLGNDQEASDHVQKLITTNGGYGGLDVYRLKPGIASVQPQQQPMPEYVPSKGLKIARIFHTKKAHAGAMLAFKAPAKAALVAAAKLHHPGFLAKSHGAEHAVVAMRAHKSAALVAMKPHVKAAHNTLIAARPRSAKPAFIASKRQMRSMLVASKPRGLHVTRSSALIASNTLPALAPRYVLSGSRPSLAPRVVAMN